MVCGWASNSICPGAAAVRLRAFSVHPTSSGENGYASIDALVALMILSLAVILSMTALQQARQAANAALEVREAGILLSRLLESGPRSMEPASGQAQGFAWALNTTPTGSERPIEVCRRQALVTSAASGRSYAAATQETCPPAAAAG